MFELKNQSEFIINDFQNAKSFASFLPGLVGENGIPIWAFYVNRGQAISSFGIENKDSAITEFFPADKAYQYTPYQAFRTFIKIKNKDKNYLVEPFLERLDDKHSIKEKMIVHANYIELAYVHEEYKIELNVRYYVLPDSPVGGLVREVKLTNKSKEAMDIELADGLASIFPANIANMGYKEIGNTLKSWFDVEYNDDLYNFYFLRGSTDDTEHVEEINNGNFYASLVVDKDGEKVGDIVYDRNVIFGNDESLTYPKYFLNHTVSELLGKNQYGTNKVSSGFTLWEDTLDSQSEVKLYTIIGHGESREIVKDYLQDNLNEVIFNEKFTFVKNISQEIVTDVETKTNNKKFDSYVSQMYLDNGLRGGFPRVYSYGDKQQIYYMYSRKHGDLERDYNFFSTSPTYYSQGNGNYRDINQNRRMDVILHPEIEDYNIQHFINLLQLDGYNPLEISKVTFNFTGNKVALEKAFNSAEDITKIMEFFKKEFEPGTLLSYIKNEEIELTISFEEFLSLILNNSEENLNSQYGEGYWIDHWTYNLDLIDSYLAIYPDQKQQLFFEKKYKYYKNEAYIKPRSQKYQSKNGKLGQYDALVGGLNAGNQNKWVTASDNQLLQTNLFSKLLLLAAIKAATISPYGYGIAMEAGKPGWNDALNGLPGLFGASTSELYEVKRLLELLTTVKVEENNLVSLPIEAYFFIKTLIDYAKYHFNKDDSIIYWDKVSTILEDYRALIYKEISGEQAQFSNDEVRTILDVLKNIIDTSIDNVENLSDDCIVPTYFYFNIEQVNDEYEIEAFDVAPFLEGNVKKMKLSQSLEEAQQLYNEIKCSEIYDKKLQMYKTSVSTDNEPKELGRIRSFVPGWLENESVFLHMEYKYLLEVLRAGLYDEYFADIDTMLIPFLDPEVYGRNIIENSTFIASSANPDSSTHGRGYVARLSGSTVEFLNMWKEMFIGTGPFDYDQSQEELVFYLKPVLNHKFFSKDGEVHFKLFSEINVTYHNELNANTYGSEAVGPVEYIVIYKNGNKEIIKDYEIRGLIAKDIRAKLVKTIDVKLS